MPKLVTASGKIKSAFDRKYVKPDGTLQVDTETAYALALYANLIPEDLRQAAGAVLARKVRDGETADDSGMTTGFLGTAPLLSALSDTGQNDTAVKLFQSLKYPSWGYEVEQGATTIWERWNSYTKAKGLGGAQNAAMNSFDHYSFGAVCEWMFTHLAGIDQDGPGWQHIIIHPMPPSPRSDSKNKPINWVKAHYGSIRGRIESNWRLKDGRFQLDTTIPANTTATVILPTKNADKITEHGKALSKAHDVKLIRQEDGRCALAVGSGHYEFVCPFDQ